MRFHIKLYLADLIKEFFFKNLILFYPVKLRELGMLLILINKFKRVLTNAF